MYPSPNMAVPGTSPRPIIFLDVDGVLHPFHHHQAHSTTFNRDCMERLAEIVISTDAELVLSSSWRNFANTRGRLTANLAEYEMSYSRWIEPDSVASVSSPSGGKLAKILAFVQAHHPTEWVVLDDEDLVTLSGADPGSLMVQLFQSRFIRTNPMYGLVDADMNTIIEALARQE